MKLNINNLLHLLKPIDEKTPFKFTEKSFHTGLKFPVENLPDISSDYFEDQMEIHQFSSEDLSVMQLKYKTQDWKLIPNRVIYMHDKPFFQINSYGLKGRKIVNNGKKKVAIWGDSVAFGIGAGWAELASKGNLEIFSGGVEGAPADKIIRNAEEINAQINFDLNVFSLGWHSKLDKSLINQVLERAKKLPNCAMFSLPYSLNIGIASRDISNEFLYKDSTETAYVFWGNLEYSVDEAVRQVKLIMRQNNIMRKFCRKNAIPFLDFEEILCSQLTHDNYRNDFYDLGHPRMSLYPRMGETLYNFVCENISK